MEKFIEVFCIQSECLFYAPHARDPKKCHCSHPEKHRYINNLQCPLYRLDWQKQAKAMATPKKQKPR